MYTKIETAMKMINIPKHPMANSLLIWLMEYLMNSKNMDMAFFTIKINTNKNRLLKHIQHKRNS